MAQLSTLDRKHIYEKHHPKSDTRPIRFGLFT